MPESSQDLDKFSAEIEKIWALYENLPCICFTINLQGGIVAASSFGARALGYELAELTQKDISQIFRAENCDRLKLQLSELQQHSTTIKPWEARLISKENRKIWVRASACVVNPTSPNPIINLVCQDITAQKEAEEQLRRSEELHRHTLSNISDTVLITNDKGDFTFVCPNVSTIFGYSQAEAWAMGNIAQLLGNNLVDRQVLAARGEIANIEREIVDKTGQSHTLLVSAKRVSIQEGTCLYSCRDISDRKGAEIQLEQSREQLETRVTERTTELRQVNEQLRREIDERQRTEQALRESEAQLRQIEKAVRQQFIKEQLVGAIAQHLHESLDLEKILNTTVAQVRQVLECDRVLVYHLHEDGSGTIVVESVGADWNRIAGTVIHDGHFAETYLQLYQQGRVQVVEDLDTAGLTPCHTELLAQFQVKANLVVPIVHEERLWGLLVAQQCSAPRQWQPMEIDLLKSLAAQAAVAIQQSELYQKAQAEIEQRQQAEAELRQLLQREQLVRAVSQRIRQSLDLDIILNATVAEVRHVLQTDRTILFRFNPDWSGYVAVESVGEGWTSILGAQIYDPCFEESYVVPYLNGRIRAIDDIYRENLDECHVGLLAQLQVKANLIVPILKGDQLWGLLIAHHCTSPRHWQPFEIDLLSAIAAQVAIAIQQGQLYEQAQAQARRERAFNQVTQAIRSSLDLGTVFSTAVREIGELLQVDRAEIVQYLPDRKLWLNVSEYRRSVDLPASLGQEILGENNPIAEQLKNIKIVEIVNTEDYTDSINQNLAEEFPGSWLFVPLHFGGTILGSLTLGRNDRPYYWQDSDMELICAIASQVAIAIHQSQLYEQSRSATSTAQTKAEQLERTLADLQKAQAQLVQSEKMSSLGQLVAGVAHEINNPVNFIYANLGYARDYTEDILGLLRLYQQQFPNPTPEIWDEIVRIDLDFVLADLPKLLESMKVGAERICEIIRSLRTFSRFAEAEMKAVDLHEGLDSTLMILQSRLKANGKHPEIQVLKEYGNLPKVECYAGQLNQVFMNLLANAIDAIDQQNEERSPEEIAANPSWIRISTAVGNDSQIVIQIADNGPGMTEPVRQRLFDPFFTTKPVGTGTGLGLSISYQIVVEKHRGQLYCHSKLGQGTEFAIEIPLKHCCH